VECHAVVIDAHHWFANARFGMFVHWGPASIDGRELSWPLVGGNPVLPYAHPTPVETYYADHLRFRPAPGAAREWMAAARRAGMRYAVLTTKHHDGFALWPSSRFSIADTPYDGDLVREYADAARAEGLRVGFYFSLPDWRHPDYPAFTDADRPYMRWVSRRGDAAAWDRYLAHVMAQLRELLTSYGRVDLLWFDGGWERRPDEWRAAELEAMIRGIQPDVVINDRLPGSGDYATPEQLAPATPPDGPWETCLTMNRTWGWCPEDTEWKSPRDLVHTLCQVAAGGGNLLLNVSPTGDGSLPVPQRERLDAIAGWMARHAQTIHDTRPGLAPWQFYGPSTRAGDRVFLHCVMRPYDTVTVRGVPIRRVRSVRAVGTDTALDFTTRAAALDELLNADPPGELVIRVPPACIDDLATVLALDIAAQ
jgi:alpha-L-fucosidase